MIVELPEPAASVTVLPETGLPLTSFNVTVTVEVVEPSAATDDGDTGEAPRAVAAPALPEDIDLALVLGARRVLTEILARQDRFLPVIPGDGQIAPAVAGGGGMPLGGRCRLPTPT